MNEDDVTALPPTSPGGSAAMRPGGGHQLALRFSGAAAPSAPPRKRRKKRTGLVLGIMGGTAVIAGLSIAQMTANLGYDAAEIEHRDVVSMANSAKQDLRTENTDLLAVTDSAGLILGSENKAIVVPAPAEETLAGAVSEAEGVAASADELIDTDVPVAGEKPTWFWELFAATTQLEQHSDDVSRLADELTAESTEIAEASTVVTESGIALMGVVGDAASDFEAAHISARNDAVISLREAAADAVITTTIDENTVAVYVALQDAATQVVSTEKAELGEKSGPLMNVRLEIEAFARSLAPGVLLEFDWARIVNGVGDNGSMGGYTTWWWDDPDRATIELSNSIAEQWPAARSKALVAHEVGHAISVKCEDMYDSSTQDSIEKWATAWAISMGFTDDANGVWAYGYPPQNYIDAAAGCR